MKDLENDLIQRDMEKKLYKTTRVQKSKEEIEIDLNNYSTHDAIKKTQEEIDKISENQEGIVWLG